MEWSDIIHVTNWIKHNVVEFVWWAVKQADRPIIFWTIFFLAGVVAPFLIGYSMGHTAGWADGYNYSIGYEHK